MIDFEFDLSDDNNVENTIEEIQIVKVKYITELSEQQKIDIDNLLWRERKLTNSETIEKMMEIGLSEVLASNIVFVHRSKYINDPYYFTIFDLSKRAKSNAESVFKKDRYFKRTGK